MPSSHTVQGPRMERLVSLVTKEAGLKPLWDPPPGFEAVCGVKQNFRNPGLIELEMFVWGLLELQPWRPRSKMHLNCHPQATKQGRLIMAENLQDYINRLSRIRTGAGKK